MAKTATAEAPPVVREKTQKYSLMIRFTEPMLASSPADPAVYEQHIASRLRQDQEKAGEEVDTLPAAEIEKIGSSVFHSDSTGVFIYDYKVRGFMKEAAAAVTGKTQLTAYKSKIDKWCFVQPRRLYLYEGTTSMNGDGKDQRTKDSVVATPHGNLQRPIRAMTAQGPRVTVKKSETVIPGTWFTCTILVLPLGVREIKEEMVREWLDYGQFSGLGEWRTGSYGRFEYELTKL